MKSLHGIIKIKIQYLASMWKLFLNNKLPPVKMDIKTAINLGIERKFITDEVLTVISFCKGSAVKNPPITMDTKIVADLGLEHDAEDIISYLQERIGIQPPLSAWQTAITVRDVIDLLLKYAHKENNS